MRLSVFFGAALALLPALPAIALGQGAGQQAPVSAQGAAKTPPTDANMHPNEDWATPSLKTSRLTAQPPFVAETDRRPRFIRQIVQVQWRELDAINLFVIRPVGVARPPVVLYLYGYPSDTSRFLKDDYVERLTRQGCAAVGFESALTGSRYQLRAPREWFVSQLPEALSTTTHDVSMILDYLATRGDLDMGHVAMFGQGSGGAIAAMAAAVDPRIRAIDLLNPWGDWPDWLKNSSLVPSNERPNDLTPQFEESVAPLDPALWLKKIRGCRVRLIQSADDTDTPPDARNAIAQALPANSQVQQFTSNAAMFNQLGGGRLFQWVAQQLRATPPKALAASTSSQPAPTETIPTEK